jgi:hypothetical protein
MIRAGLQTEEFGLFSLYAPYLIRIIPGLFDGHSESVTVKLHRGLMIFRVPYDTDVNYFINDVILPWLG